MQRPSMDEWIREAKQDASADKCGMYLFHNGVVRATPKAVVRPESMEKFRETDSESIKKPRQADPGASGDRNNESRQNVSGMEFSYDRGKVSQAIQDALELPGIFYIRVWLNDGQLKTGDDIMLVLIGGDIRPHVVDALQELVGNIKNNCVTEKEIYETGK